MKKVYAGIFFAAAILCGCARRDAGQPSTWDSFKIKASQVSEQLEAIPDETKADFLDNVALFASLFGGGVVVSPALHAFAKYVRRRKKKNGPVEESLENAEQAEKELFPEADDGLNDCKGG